MPKKMIFGILALLLVAGIVFALIALKPKPETPNTVVTAIGAQATFISKLDADGNETNPIVRILDEKYGITVNVLTNSGLNAFQQNGVVDYHGVDVIFGGSASFSDELKVQYPDGLPNSAGDPLRVLEVKTVAQSPLAIHVKTGNGDLEAFLAAGVFELGADESYYISGPSLVTVINCAAADGDWNSIGVQIPGKCRLGFSNPAKSSGGRYTVAFSGGCLVDGKCEQTITAEQLPQVMNQLMHLVEISGKKPGDNDSLEFYYNWANSSVTAERLMFAYESAPIAWLSSPFGPSPAQRSAAANSIAVVYPRFTFMSTQAGVSLTDSGKRLVEIMTSDPDIIQAMNEVVGFRVGFGGALPDVIPSIATNPQITIIPDPAASVTKAIVAEICARSPEHPGCQK